MTSIFDINVVADHTADYCTGNAANSILIGSKNDLAPARKIRRWNYDLRLDVLLKRR